MIAPADAKRHARILGVLRELAEDGVQSRAAGEVGQLAFDRGQRSAVRALGQIAAIVAEPT